MAILIVEDKKSFQQVLKKTLEGEGYTIETADDGQQAINKIKKKKYELILSDLKLPKADGLEVLKEARERDPQLPLILFTAFGTIQDAVSAIKGGAIEFLEKPVKFEVLLPLLKNLIEHRRLQLENMLLKEEFREKYNFPCIIGEAPRLQEIEMQIQKVAPTDATVLIQGESGTGKELFARAIHTLSRRKDRHFVAINCAAIPDTLLENELFGHEKGAYTDAGSLKMGKFELADGGTIFLDEIGDLSSAVQAKLLRVLQEKNFERVGGNQTIEVDVRIIAATNQNLRELVEEGKFREDLFFRISVFPINIIPLSKRRGDIPLLVDHFINLFSAELHKEPIKMTPEAMKVLTDYSWPGNVRELENLIERLLILSEKTTIRPEDLKLPSGSYEDPGEKMEEIFDFTGSLQDVCQKALRIVEEKKTRDALKESGGNRNEAAKSLGISYKTLLSKMREYGIE